MNGVEKPLAGLWRRGLRSFGAGHVSEGRPGPLSDVVRPLEPAFRYVVTFADGDTGPDAAATAGIAPRILPPLQEQ
ncbi:hypothetical protein ACFPOI_30770 [Nonomuraea angiospora]|uniref:Uncharacterized protein n=1 Tax=Nonomuraea angiospora TaxID=46172 RepID=A0ABR9LUZ5_9ACTN|nr:hypothetical protein [Nonomuraea angiospora]MBE1584461.1 hypothetical protein [Nonomuraea angiospora]